MPTPEDKLVNAASDVKGAIEKVKVWYKDYPFYVGIVAGALAALVVRHFL